jgi:hypothetical protein
MSEPAVDGAAAGISEFSATTFAAAKFEVGKSPARVASAGAARVALDSCVTTSLDAGFKLKLATAP